jgi:putative chitinase
MKTRSELEWARILIACGVRQITAARWSPAFAMLLKGDALSAGDAELDDFLGQVLHECNFLERLEEGLNYSTPGRLMAVWPSRFPSLESERPYLRNPEALANKVYGGRMGNVEPGDGWKYRGRGPIQLTGRDNYAATGAAIGVDLVGNPGLMTTPAVGLEATIRWWERTVPDSVMGNLPAVTKRVNGGTTGIAERRHITEAAARALAAS